MTVATTDTQPFLASTQHWRAGMAAVSVSDSTKGLMVTKLLTRPKTTTAVHRTPSVHGPQYSIQVLGEKLAQSQSQPAPQGQERPKTSVTRCRDRERPATSSKERPGFVAVQGKELPLPICTTRNARSTGSDKEILSITTKLRNKSAVGQRSLASLIGPTSRDRSAALLTELTVSLSLTHSKNGPISPFKDCLRERWRTLSRDPSVLSSTYTETPASPSTVPLNQDAAEDTASALSVDCAQSGADSSAYLERNSKGARTRRSCSVKDIQETLIIRSSSPSKDSAEITRRSSSPVRDPSTKLKHPASVKRVRSTGNVLPSFGLSSNENTKVPKRDSSLKVDKDVVVRSPRIITINRIPSPAPAPAQQPRTKVREKVGASGKPASKAALSISVASVQRNSEEVPSGSVPSHSSSKENLVESPLRRDAPCNVTSFDMAISSVKDGLASPRARAPSMTSDSGQPVSVREDTVLRMCALHQQPPSFSSATKLETATTQKGELMAENPSLPRRDESREDNAAIHRVCHEDKPRLSSTDSSVFSPEYNTARTSGSILISPRQADSAQINGETVRVLHSDSVENNTIHVPIRNDSSDSYSSSSTPTVPLSSSELLYGNGEGSGRSGPGQGHGGEDVAAGDIGAWDHRTHDKQKLKELELHGNKRPPSRNNSNRRVPNFDKVSLDREREELRPLANSLAPSKQSPLRANGIKNNLLRPDQFLNQRANGGTGREEDLVAMGTLWSPSQLQTRGSSTTTSSGKSTSAPNSSGNYSANSLPVRRAINLSTSTSTRQLLHQSNNSSMASTGNAARAPKEVEPKYSDPLAGASPTFQQRLMELAALEAETVRWERTKKIKKKPKQDRDS